MADQNRSGDGRFRRDNDDEDRRWQRRDEEDDWRREDRGQRSFGRNEGYGRGGRGYGDADEARRGEQSGQGARFGAAERDEYDYGRSRSFGSGSRQDYGRDYGGSRYGSQGGYGGEQGYGSQRQGSEGQGYGSQRYGNQGGIGSGQDYESQRHAGVGHSGLSGRDYSQGSYGNQRYGAEQSYGSQRYGSSQDREEQYGSSGYGTPQYGAFGSAESGRQGRLWQQFGRGSTSESGGWQRGEQRGKGPKGYTRSDERIREDVCDCLSDDDELDASEITVTVKGGEVTLEGSVSDRHAKQRAEDLAEGVSGVRDVDNKLRKNKGMLQEMGDRLTGSQNNERGGHSGSGTKNAPANASMSR